MYFRSLRGEPTYQAKKEYVEEPRSGRCEKEGEGKGGFALSSYVRKQELTTALISY